MGHPGLKQHSESLLYLLSCTCRAFHAAEALSLRLTLPAAAKQQARQPSAAGRHQQRTRIRTQLPAVAVAAAAALEEEAEEEEAGQQGKMQPAPKKQRVDDGAANGNGAAQQSQQQQQRKRKKPPSPEIQVSCPPFLPCP